MFCHRFLSPCLAQRGELRTAAVWLCHQCCRQDGSACYNNTFRLLRVLDEDSEQSWRGWLQPVLRFQPASQGRDVGRPLHLVSISERYRELWAGCAGRPVGGAAVRASPPAALPAALAGRRGALYGAGGCQHGAPEGGRSGARACLGPTGRRRETRPWGSPSSTGGSRSGTPASARCWRSIRWAGSGAWLPARGLQPFLPAAEGALRGEGRGRLSGIGGARGGRLRLQPGGAGRAGGTSEPAESRVAPSPPPVGTPDPATAGVEAGTRARPAVPAPRSEHPAARAFCSLGLAELRGRSVPRSGTPLAAVPKVGRADPSERNRLRYLLVSGSRLLVVGSPRWYRRGFS